MRCSVCREEEASVAVGTTGFCLMDYNCSPHMLEPPRSLRVLNQALYEQQLQATEELWRSAISEALVQLIQQQEKVRAKEQENPLAMLDVPTYTGQAAVRQVPLRIPRKRSKKQRTERPVEDPADALNPYQRRPTRPQNILTANPGQAAARVGEPSSSSSSPATAIRGPVCPSCASTQTRVLVLGIGLEVAPNETWGSKDAPAARRKCECDDCGFEWIVED